MGFTVPLVLSVLGEAASGFLKSDLLAGIGALNTALSLIDRAKGLTKGEKHETKKIVRRMGEAVQTRLEREGSEADRQAYLGAATSAEIVLDGLVKSKEALVRAARCDADVLVAYVYDNGGAAMRRDVDQKAEGLFDDLLAIVADGLAGLARTSPDFLRHALLVSLDNQEALMGGQEAVLELVQRHGQDLSVVRQALDEIREGAPAGSELQAAVSRLSEVVAAKTKAAPAPETAGPLIRFGSPPARAAGFIGRDRQDDLYTALGRPEPADSQRQRDTVRPAHGSPEARGPNTDGAGRPAGDSGPSPDGAGRAANGSGSSTNGVGSSAGGGPVVVCGMRGVGKSQLAAAYARDCEKAGWPLVAWMDASSREALVAGLAGLAVEMGIDDGKGDPDAAACRCVTRLNSGEGDRLLVFDNVEDFDDLKKLIPHGQGLRVLVTTTVASPGDSAGRLIAVGAFTRPQSIDFIRERTGLDDAGAARLAEELGDLPVALAQAAATIKLNGYATLDEYLAELREYRLDEVVDRLPGDDYPNLVHAALRKAYESALDMLAEKDRSSGEEDLPRAAAASVQLAALALLAPSGVPRPWLHRIGTRMPIARQSLGALVAHSICTPSQDGRYVRIHSLQGRVLREDYNKQPEVFASLEKAVVTLLEGIDMDEASKNNAQRADALDMADQLRAIAEQQEGHMHYSPHEACIDLSSVTVVVGETISCLTNMGRPQIALTLTEAAEMLVAILSRDRPSALATYNNLALAYMEAGDVSKAIDIFEALIPDLVRVLGPDHPDTLHTRGNLADAYREAESISKAIDMHETLLADRTRLLGPDHPDTLNTRNNLAGAHLDAGDLQQAIDMYEALQTDQTRVLGSDHLRTLTAQNNLALAYQKAGNLRKAMDMFEALIPDLVGILGSDHPRTLAARNNLAAAYWEAGNTSKAINEYNALIPDLAYALGSDHPHTLAARNNLAYVYYAADNLQIAVEMYENLVPDLINVFGPNHPHALAAQGNLAAVRKKAQQASSPQADGEAESAPPPES